MGTKIPCIRQLFFDDRFREDEWAGRPRGLNKTGNPGIQHHLFGILFKHAYIHFSFWVSFDGLCPLCNNPFVLVAVVCNRGFSDSIHWALFYKISSGTTYSGLKKIHLITSKFSLASPDSWALQR